MDIMRQSASLIVNQSLLMAVVSSLIARRKIKPQT